MTAPEGHLDVLDPRFPIRLSQRAVIHDRMLGERPDRACARGVETRARTHDSHQQERYVTPRWVPERAHEATAEDMGLPAGWWRDSLREGMPQPEDTDVFITASLRAEMDEQAAAERRPVRRARRAIRHLVRGT